MVACCVSLDLLNALRLADRGHYYICIAGCKVAVFHGMPLAPRSSCFLPSSDIEPQSWPRESSFSHPCQECGPQEAFEEEVKELNKGQLGELVQSSYWDAQVVTLLSLNLPVLSFES
jgi:hypothetical protein